MKVKMKIEDLKNEINIHFPNSEMGRTFYAKQNIFLEEKYAFTPENTRFAEGGCCDEINEPEYLLMESYWGERFKFGGLAGYCHGGKTGLKAVSHHVPEVDGRKNLLLVAGPHIGYYEGEWGKVPRTAQSHITTSCGSLAAVVEEGYEKIIKKPEDFLDRQQQTVEELMLPYLKKCAEAGNAPGLVEATKFLMQRIDTDLLSIVQDLETQFDGQIAVITGITINAEHGNYFSPSKVLVLEST
jgi:hypothetical protein